MSVNGNQMIWILCGMTLLLASVISFTPAMVLSQETPQASERTVLSLRPVDDQRKEAVASIDLMVERELPAYVIDHAHRLVELGDDCRSKAQDYIANQNEQFLVWPIVCATERYKEVDVVYYEALFTRAAQSNRGK